MFGELELKTAYSFKDSCVLIQDAINTASNKHIEALGIIDSNMYGLLEFNNACLKNNIKPIFGLEISITIEGEPYPFNIYAYDDFGYNALVSLNNLSSIVKKEITVEVLSKYLPHIHVVSSSDDCIIQRLLQKEMESEAIKYLKQFNEVFKEHFFVSLHSHDLMYQTRINERLMNICKLLGVTLICANDVRYIKKEDAFTFEMLQASKNNSTLSLDHTPKTSERYLKNVDEMSILFDQDIILNTQSFIDGIHCTICLNQPLLPKYPLKNNIDSKEYLRQLCVMGLKKRFKGSTITNVYKERLHYELDVIHQMGFDDYFLIVFDYVRFAKVSKIQVGVGRGSACGSLVSYCLGITNIDPIQYGLMFERFLNPKRVSMPDIDIDFQDNRRDEVVNYIVNKYGQEYVCQIVTFSTYGPKVALRDMSKVLEIPAAKVEMISKYIPTQVNKKKTLAELYNTSPSYQGLIVKDAKLSKIYPSLCLIEFLPKNISMHAAGVVISSSHLQNVIPLTSDNGVVMSQYSKNYIESVGLLKMDLLGLRNLTMLDYIVKDIKEYEHVDLNINNLPLNDQKTFDLISHGDTYGVFQLESAGMVRLLKQLKPKDFNTIVDAIALYRPGPMENIPAYIQGKANPGNITYLIPELKPILSSTYGIIVYQEQIMAIARDLAGFSLGEADILRKAVSKKEGALMAELKADFIKGSSSKISVEQATQVYELIEKFANYGFNKAHSVAYGYIAYQLAFLKANYPLYFYAAILSGNAGSVTTRIHCLSECKAKGIQILKPSVNESTDRFMIVDGKILYPLTQIKNVGSANYQTLMKVRYNQPFTDFFDFVERCSDASINNRTIESLIDAGALDEFNLSRTTMKNNLEKVKEYSDFKKSLGIDEKPILMISKDYPNVTLELEREVLGLYLSSHPVEVIKAQYSFNTPTINTLNNYINQRVEIVVNVQRIKPIIDKRGNEMAFLDLNDETSSIDAVVFASTYSNVKNKINRNAIVKMVGKVNYKDTLSFVVDDVIMLEEK